MRPKMSTSFRPHGKWGDFLACIIPAIWVINILTNSNFILRLIEWQNESSLMTIRIRAKQWYWVYKYELKNFTDILVAPKNIGTNRWVTSTFGDMQSTGDYLHVLQLRSQSKWVSKFWNENTGVENISDKDHIISPQEQMSSKITKSYTLANLNNTVNGLIIDKPYAYSVQSFSDLFLTTPSNYVNTAVVENYNTYYNSNFLELFEPKDVDDSESLFLPYSHTPSFYLYTDEDLGDIYEDAWNDNYVYTFLSNSTESDNLFSSKPRNLAHFDELDLKIKRTSGPSIPLRILKYPLGSREEINTVGEDYLVELFSFKFGSGEPELVQKIDPHTTYYTFKQQRYTRKKNINPLSSASGNPEDGALKPYSIKPFLVENVIMENNVSNPTIQYGLVKKNKSRNNLIPVTLAKRLLRTDKTLVLPAQINITLITNSYDVVHSWFIPGLGLKLDCVPGRSTHHTLYIDSVGFYYGQCAEICGRFHHHMPIRMCALPFEQFLIWWHTFGFPSFITNKEKHENHVYLARKYTW